MGDLLEFLAISLLGRLRCHPMPHGASLVPGDGRPTFGRSKLGPKNRRATNEKNTIEFWISEGHHPPSPGAEEVRRPLPNLYLTGHRPSGGKQLPSGGMGGVRLEILNSDVPGPGFLLVFFYYLFLWVKWRFWRLHPNVCSTPPPFFFGTVCISHFLS